jgi:hypothetical protein
MVAPVVAKAAYLYGKFGVDEQYQQDPTKKLTNINRLGVSHAHDVRVMNDHSQAKTMLMFKSSISETLKPFRCLASRQHSRMAAQNA